MTRTSIARLADCAPVASPESWPARKAPRLAAGCGIPAFARLYVDDTPAMLRAHAFISRSWQTGMLVDGHAVSAAISSGDLEAIWRQNMARRDADAARYGEPRNSSEFYRGRKS